MGSIWSDTVQIKAGNILKEDISADNVIIGGGIDGISFEEKRGGMPLS